MPGGSNFRQWYAMRSRLQREGRWQHRVPQQEEGEPPAQRPTPDNYWRTNAGLDIARNLPERSPDPATPESLPSLEASPTAEGEYGRLRNWVFSPCMGEG